MQGLISKAVSMLNQVAAQVITRGLVNRLKRLVALAEPDHSGIAPRAAGRSIRNDITGRAGVAQNASHPSVAPARNSN